LLCFTNAWSTGKAPFTIAFPTHSAKLLIKKTVYIIYPGVKVAYELHQFLKEQHLFKPIGDPAISPMPGQN